MNRLKNALFHVNTSIRKRMLMLYSAAFLIPVIVLSMLILYLFSDFVNTQTMEALNAATKQAAENIDGKISRMQSIANTLSTNSRIVPALFQNELTRFEVYSYMTYDISPTITNAEITNPEIDQVDYITDNPAFLTRNGIINSTGADLGDWLTQADSSYEITWHFGELSLTDAFGQRGSSEMSLFAIRRIFQSPDHGLTAYVLLKTKSQELLGSLDIGFTDGGMFVSDESGNIVYSVLRGTHAEKIAARIALKESGGTDGYFVQRSGFSIPGWQVVSFTSSETVWKKTIPVILISFGVLVLCFLIAYLLLVLFSGKIFRRIEMLESTVALAAEGNLDTYSKDMAADEIGRLSQGYNNMLKNINDLIDRVYRAEIQYRESEVKALQAQISPHFLNNAFSLINSMAILRNDSQISRTTNLISGYYRTLLSKGLETITIETEIENLKKYIEIQKLLHNGEVDIQFTIEEQVLPCKIMSMLLQPVVENAIEHGVDRLEEPGTGVIRISAVLEHSDILFKIFDNGPGFTSISLEEVLEGGSKSYGLYNVQNRVKYLYGEPFGLYCEESPGGTVVVLRIPKLE